MPTGGLLNTVGAPHLSEASTYMPSYTGDEELDSITKHHTSLEVAMAMKSFQEIGYPPKVRAQLHMGLRPTWVFCVAGRQRDMNCNEAWLAPAFNET